MSGHIRANLWLLVLTMLIGAVLYPLALLGIGQIAFNNKAQGSLIADKDGKVIGSRIIAQPFSGDEYFHPRPSAASYNGAASAASNWGANNPNLRKRVLATLGPNVKYRDGRPVGPDVVTWFREQLQKDPSLIGQWSKNDGGLGDRWTGADSANADFVAKWASDHPDDMAGWKKEHEGPDPPKPGELAALFFESYAKGETKTWPETDGKDIQAAFFGVWFDAHPQAEFDPVPADMVMASGCGLDPHITLQNALYQVDRVAAKRAEMTKRNSTEIRKAIEALLRQNASAPLGGLVGVDIVNVLEINLALNERFGS